MGASSYIVASDNLGDRAGIVAASALLIGYTRDGGGLGVGRRARP